MGELELKEVNDRKALKVNPVKQEDLDRKRIAEDVTKETRDYTVVQLEDALALTNQQLTQIQIRKEQLEKILETYR